MTPWEALREIERQIDVQHNGLGIQPGSLVGKGKGFQQAKPQVTEALINGNS